MTEKQWGRLMNLGARYGCHQRADRSFFCGKWQFPLCARCTGVLVSTIAALLLRPWLRLKSGTAFRMLLPMVADWGIQRTGVKESTNRRRFVTGFLGGFGLMSLYLTGIRKILHWLRIG